MSHLPSIETVFLFTWSIVQISRFDSLWHLQNLWTKTVSDCGFLYSAGRIKSACLVWVNNWFWLALSVYCLMLRTCNSVKLLTASCRHLNIRNCIRCQNMYCTKPHAAYAAPLSLLIVGRFRLWLTIHGLSLVHDCLDIDLGTVTWLDNLVKNTVRLCGL